jgi:hypothetical protein
MQPGSLGEVTIDRDVGVEAGIATSRRRSRPEYSSVESAICNGKQSVSSMP